MISSQPSPFHNSQNFDFLKEQHSVDAMDLVFGQKWVKSVRRCTLFIFHLSELNEANKVCQIFLCFFFHQKQPPERCQRRKSLLLLVWQLPAFRPLPPMANSKFRTRLFGASFSFFIPWYLTIFAASLCLITNPPLSVGGIPTYVVNKFQNSMTTLC